MSSRITRRRLQPWHGILAGWALGAGIVLLVLATRPVLRDASFPALVGVTWLVLFPIAIPASFLGGCIVRVLIAVERTDERQADFERAEPLNEAEKWKNS